MPPAHDVSRNRRFAFAVFEPAADSSGFLLCCALEELAGNPYVGLAASDYSSLLVLFASPEAQEETMAKFPLDFGGHSIKLERPEHAANRFGWCFSYFAQLCATSFPLEHWDEGGIRTAFRSIGSVCCIDPLCLNELDFSAVRLVIKLEDDRDVPHALLMRDAGGESSAEVRIRVVRVWPAAVEGSLGAPAQFDDLGGGSPASPRDASPPSRGGVIRLKRIYNF
jgi:hypothetical protein